MDEIKQVITASSSRKRERAERTKAEDFDAEEGELLKEENEQEEEVFDQVCLSTIYDIQHIISIFFLLLCLSFMCQGSFYYVYVWPHKLTSDPGG